MEGEGSVGRWMLLPALLCLRELVFGQKGVCDLCDNSLLGDSFRDELWLLWSLGTSPYGDLRCLTAQQFLTGYYPLSVQCKPGLGCSLFLEPRQSGFPEPKWGRMPTGLHIGGPGANEYWTFLLLIPHIVVFVIRCCPKHTARYNSGK